MADTDNLTLEQVDAQDGPPEPRPTAPPIESRFLFVDVAAMRAKQLRRGARPRLEEFQGDGDDWLRTPVLKPERVAMEEVRRGYVLYEVPETRPAPAEAP